MPVDRVGPLTAASAGRLRNQAAAGGSIKIDAAKLAAKLFMELLDRQGTHGLGPVRFGVVVEPFVPS